MLYGSGRERQMPEVEKKEKPLLEITGLKK